MRKRILMAAAGAGLFSAASLAVLPAMAQAPSTASPASSGNANTNSGGAASRGVLAGATKAVNDLRSDPHYNDLIARCKGLFIMPSMTHGLLGEHGQAVLVRNGSGGWTQPAFLTFRRMSPESLSSQGAQSSQGSQSAQRANPTGGETILMLMTSKALTAFSKADNISVGPDADLAVIKYSGQAKVPVKGGDVIVWSKHTMARPNTSFHVTDIKANKQKDHTFYGKAVTTSQILHWKVTQKTAANSLAEALAP
ncbi:MAG: hypothetical protein HIU92_12360 [Proteobacteria bacterium]|nr:hypothetical protein [Pseudomonadota bacterium]